MNYSDASICALNDSFLSCTYFINNVCHLVSTKKKLIRGYAIQIKFEC